MAAAPTVKMSLHLTQETNNILENMCEENRLTKSDLLRKSLALMEVVLRYKKKGGHLIIVDDQDQKISEIVGV